MQLLREIGQDTGILAAMFPCLAVHHRLAYVHQPDHRSFIQMAGCQAIASIPYSHCSSEGEEACHLANPTCESAESAHAT